ncbi:MAG: hypothetical protein KAY00_05250 [Agitococcus sp.]|jgi:hypothetical protein|nr:hypothetical protein [Agitococcus sp.]
MKYGEFYANLSQKASLIIWLVFITIIILSLGALILGGEVVMQLEPLKVEVKKQK